MPALQVRDCPMEVYEKLRACAAAENRSIAQQTLTIIEEYLDMREKPSANTPVQVVKTHPRYSGEPRQDEGVDYLSKFQATLKRLDELPPIPATVPRADILLAQIREEEAK